MFMVVVASALLVAGCKDKKGGDEAGSDSATTTAANGPIQECEDYFKAVKVCIDNSKGSAKQAFALGRAQFEQQAEGAVGAAGRKNAANSCRSASLALTRSPACMAIPDSE
jgi:hypothetical protein